MSDLVQTSSGDVQGETFRHAPEFRATEPTAGLGLGPLEEQYQQLFAEVLEDGIITGEERSRLERAAGNLGLDLERLSRLEEAMTAAYESHHRVRVINQRTPPQVSLPLSEGGLSPAALPRDAQAHQLSQLQRENEALRHQVALLQAELERAQSLVNIEIDLRSLDEENQESLDPVEVWKQVRQDPTDVAALRRLKTAFEHQSNRDGEFLSIQALVSLKAANELETRFFEEHREKSLIAPHSSISEELWRNNLAHPDDEATVGALFSLVVPAVLFGRVTALRRDKSLFIPDLNTQQDPSQSTVMAVRALAWASTLLGLPVPLAFVDPQSTLGYAQSMGLPPFTILGKGVLRGKSIAQLAFLVGQHASGYRGDHFIKSLFTATEDLEDVFLAALLLANPKLPIVGAQRDRIDAISRSIEPMLDGLSRESLRVHYLRFVEDGGRANLQRWSRGVEKSAARVGFALCQDLPLALSLLEPQEGTHGPLALDLLSYSTSQKFLQLRASLGISLQ